MKIIDAVWKVLKKIILIILDFLGNKIVSYIILTFVGIGLFMGLIVLTETDHAMGINLETVFWICVIPGIIYSTIGTIGVNRDEKIEKQELSRKEIEDAVIDVLSKNHTIYHDIHLQGGSADSVEVLNFANLHKNW